MTFADALNSVDSVADFCDGRLYLTNGSGDEFSEVGDYGIFQTNNGPDVRVRNTDAGLLYTVLGFSLTGETQKPVSATYDPRKRMWVDDK